MTEIRKIYFAHFLVGFATIASVTWTLYFLSYGISQSQIGILFAVFMVILSIFDIPTGSFADIFGHKASVAIGLFIQSTAGLFFFLFPTFNGFLLGMIMAGFGAAFSSGALSSLIYDITDKTLTKGDFQKIKGRADGCFLIASIFASIIGAIIYKYHPRLPNVLYFIFICIASFVIYRIKWEFKKKPHTVFSFIKKIHEGLFLTLRNKKLIAVMLIGISLTLSRMLFNQNISQPYQLQIGVDVSFIGITAAAVAAIQALISIYAYKIYKKLGAGLSLYFIVFIPSLSAFILAFLNNIYAISLILVFYTGHAFRESALVTIGQQEAKDKHRATMASTISFFSGIVVALLLPIFGYGIDLYGIRSILIVMAFFTAIVGSLGIFIFESKST